MEGAAPQTINTEHFFWDLECPHFKSNYQVVVPRLPRQDITVGNWNVRASNHCEKLKWLTHALDKYKWGIIGLPETHYKEVAKLQQNNDMTFESAATLKDNNMKSALTQKKHNQVGHQPHTSFQQNRKSLADEQNTALLARRSVVCRFRFQKVDMPEKH